MVMLYFKFMGKRYENTAVGFRKRIWYSLCLLSYLFYSCNSENAPDCFQNSGDSVRVQAEVPTFTDITVFENLNVVLKQGTQQLVEIETGEFLLNEVSVEVAGDRLILRNENSCNYVRNYGMTTIYVTSPNISQVRSSTGGLISSDGVLAYENLSIVSESFTEPEAETTDGAFDLEVDAENVSILVNGIAFVQLAGEVENLSVFIAAGDSRIEAESLIAQNVTVNHRGSNDIIINPQLQIRGVIRGYGDVISNNRPTEIDVQELYNGRLIFRD